jgi:hypothetical protein
MEEPKEKVNPELQRVAELLRPLWPGVVFVPKPELLRLDGQIGGVGLSMLVTGPGVKMWSMAASVGRILIFRVYWEAPEEAAGKLVEHRDYVRRMTDSLNAALGLEVSDVAR